MKSPTSMTLMASMRTSTPLMTTSTTPSLPHAKSPNLRSPAIAWSTMAIARSPAVPLTTPEKSTSRRTLGPRRSCVTLAYATPSSRADPQTSPSDTSLTEPTSPVTISTPPNARLNNVLHKTSTTSNSLTRYRSAMVATVPSRSALKRPVPRPDPRPRPQLHGKRHQSNLP